MRLWCVLGYPCRLFVRTICHSRPKDADELARCWKDDVPLSTEGYGRAGVATLDRSKVRTSWNNALICAPLSTEGTDELERWGAGCICKEAGQCKATTS